MIIVDDFEQGTDEWFAARAGVVSASCLDQIITSKGTPSTQAKKYMMTLAVERITGQKAEGFQSGYMQRGIEMEEEARSFYEMHTDSSVQQVALVYKDDSRKVSCSPDGLLDGSGIEIKCPSAHVAAEYLMKGKLPTAYFQQVQGSMYVTGYETWQFLSYYPGLKPLILTVKKDNAFHRALDSLLGDFLNDLDALEEKLRNA